MSFGKAKAISATTGTAGGLVYNKKKHCSDTVLFNEMRQLPTLPTRCQVSTLGSMRLNFRVRYGNGWVPHDIVTAMALCVLRKDNSEEGREGNKIEKQKQSKRK